MYGKIKSKPNFPKGEKMKTRILALILMMVIFLSSCDAAINNILENLQNKIDSETPGDQVEQPETDDPGNPPTACDDHTDIDNNGYCDDCNKYVIIVLDLYAINDLHGKLADTDDNVGVDELTTYLKTVTSLDDNAIILSSGDMWQGSSESNLTHGQIMTEWMNHLGVASMTLGNHEYDWGREYIEANDDLANFPFLAINIYDKSTNQRIDYCDASVVVEKNGAKIGIIGAIGDCYSSISGDMTSGFYFKTGTELTNLIKAESERLRTEEGVDFIVLSIHDGYDQNKSGMSIISDSNLRSYYDVSLSSGYVDIVFEGHTHKSYVLQDSKGVFHMQAGGENNGISHAEFNINIANGKSEINDAKIVSKNTYRSYTDDPIVLALLEKYKNDISKADEVLGTLSRYISSDEICELVAKVYYLRGLEEFGSQYPIVLGGGFISTRSPYDLERGQVTYSDIYSILPFDNELVLCSVSGKDLMSKFVNTTNSRYHIYYEEYGSDAIANIVNNKTYYIITDSYTSTYSYNNLTEIKRFAPNEYARDLLAAYIKAGKLK